MAQQLAKCTTKKKKATSKKQLTTKKRPSSKKRETRDKLVVAARRLFLQQGYAATSINQITKACGLTHGVFYSHFSSKQMLYDLAFSTPHNHGEATEWEAGVMSDDNEDLHNGDYLPLRFFALDHFSKQTSLTYTKALKRSLLNLQLTVNREFFSGESALLALLAMSVGAEVIANKVDDGYLVHKLRQACRENAALLGQAETPFNAEDYFWNTTVERTSAVN